MTTTNHTPAPWGIMHDGPIGDGKPWTADGESAPGLTIASPRNTEPIARVSGYLHPVEANVEFMVRAVNSHDALVEACKFALHDFDTIVNATMVPALKVHPFTLTPRDLRAALKLAGADA